MKTTKSIIGMIACEKVAFLYKGRKKYTVPKGFRFMEPDELLKLRKNDNTSLKDFPKNEYLLCANDWVSFLWRFDVGSGFGVGSRSVGNPFVCVCGVCLVKR